MMVCKSIVEPYCRIYRIQPHFKEILGQNGRAGSLTGVDDDDGKAEELLD